MTVLLGGLAAIFFGIGDLLGGVGVRKSGRPGSAVSMAIVATIVGTAVIGIFMLFMPPDSIDSSDLWWSVLAGLSMSATRPLLYLGMARGPISVFSPSFYHFLRTTTSHRRCFPNPQAAQQVPAGCASNAGYA